MIARAMNMPETTRGLFIVSLGKMQTHHFSMSSKLGQIVRIIFEVKADRTEQWAVHVFWISTKDLIRHYPPSRR